MAEQARKSLLANIMNRSECKSSLHEENIWSESTPTLDEKLQKNILGGSHLIKNIPCDLFIGIYSHENIRIHSACYPDSLLLFLSLILSYFLN